MHRKGELLETVGEPARGRIDAPGGGALIVNADDWGRDYKTTERSLECILGGTVSSVSSMVFMEDSERAAAIALDRRIDAGLHLNLTTTFSASSLPSRLIERQGRIAHYLTAHRFSQIVFHPGLSSSFEYVVKAQLEEFARLYGAEAKRIDGHHHMHVCTNVLFGKLLPAGRIVRRSFSFRSDEKPYGNRLYRGMVDRTLAKRHYLADFFFSLTPLEPHERLERILSLARRSVVEVETHPINSDEYRFLTGGEAIRWAGDVPIARCFSIAKRKTSTVCEGLPS